MAIAGMRIPPPPFCVTRCDLRRLVSLYSSEVYPLCLLRALILDDFTKLVLLAASMLPRDRFTGLALVA